MIYLKCPACGDLEPIEFEGAAPDVYVRETPCLEVFVHEHLSHLADWQLLDVIEAAGDC